MEEMVVCNLVIQIHLQVASQLFTIRLMWFNLYNSEVIFQAGNNQTFTLLAVVN